MVDKTLKSAELVTIKRGLHKVLVNTLSGEQHSITFYTKKQAQDYLKWVCGEPKSVEEQIKDLIINGII